MQYNAPTNGQPSHVGDQARTDFYKAKAIIELAEELIFSQFSDTMHQPKHHGKKVIMDHYLPILHDANLTDQGIDANGISTIRKVTIRIISAEVVASVASDVRDATSHGTYYAVGEGANAADALAAAELDAENVFKTLGVFDTDFGTTKAALLGLAEPWFITTSADVAATGNLYGSSRNIAYVQDKLPLLNENGGRVNRVGNTRKRLESEICRLGIFEEYSADSLDFDSDADLDMHNHREMLRAATEISEDTLQMDLIAGAGLIRFCGEAIATAELTGENGVIPSVVSYNDLQRMDIDLTNNHAAKSISVIRGSTNSNTYPISSARPLIIGSEMLPTITDMVDNFGKQAFRYLHEYLDGGKSKIAGEVGAINGYRVILATRMLHWAGAGAPVIDNAGYRETDGKYDVFPILIPSKGAFTEVGFRSSNMTSGKWSLMHRKPGIANMDRDDPYGMTGRRSIQWWYGVLVQRPEWIGLIKSVAKM